MRSFAQLVLFAVGSLLWSGTGTHAQSAPMVVPDSGATLRSEEAPLGPLSIGPWNCTSEVSAITSSTPLGIKRVASHTEACFERAKVCPPLESPLERCEGVSRPLECGGGTVERSRGPPSTRSI